MDTVVGSNQAAHLAFLETGQGIGVFRDEGVQLIPAHIAAFFCGDGIGRILLRGVGEIELAAIDATQNLFRQSLVTRFEQDMGRALRTIEQGGVLSQVVDHFLIGCGLGRILFQNRFLKLLLEHGDLDALAIRFLRHARCGKGAFPSLIGFEVGTGSLHARVDVRLGNGDALFLRRLLDELGILHVVDYLLPDGLRGVPACLHPGSPGLIVFQAVILPEVLDVLRDIIFHDLLAVNRCGNAPGEARLDRAGCQTEQACRGECEREHYASKLLRLHECTSSNKAAIRNQPRYFPIASFHSGFCIRYPRLLHINPSFLQALPEQNPFPSESMHISRLVMHIRSACGQSAWDGAPEG